jgi:hypothetical protein
MAAAVKRMIKLKGMMTGSGIAAFNHLQSTPALPAQLKIGRIFFIARRAVNDAG